MSLQQHTNMMYSITEQRNSLLLAVTQLSLEFIMSFQQHMGTTLIRQVNSLLSHKIIPWTHGGLKTPYGKSWLNIGSGKGLVPDRHQVIAWTNVHLSLMRSTRTIPMHTWWRHQMKTFSALLALCSGNSPVTGQWHGTLMFSLIWAWTNSWVNNWDAGDLRCHHAHYDVTVK